jgi:hypothetical protein
MKTPKILPGDFFTEFDTKLQAYKLYRILAFEPSIKGLHVSIYSNLFQEQPDSVKPDELSFGIVQVSMDEENARAFFHADDENSLAGVLKSLSSENDHVGVMHAPILLDGFDSEDLEFVQHTPLERKDLEGLQTYLDGMGFSAEEQEQYLEFVITRSYDRTLLKLNKTLKIAFPFLAAVLILCFVAGWIPLFLLVTGLLIIGLLSLYWWGMAIRSIRSHYQEA